MLSRVAENHGMSAASSGLLAGAGGGFLQGTTATVMDAVGHAWGRTRALGRTAKTEGHAWGRAVGTATLKTWGRTALADAAIYAGTFGTFEGGRTLLLAAADHPEKESPAGIASVVGAGVLGGVVNGILGKQNRHLCRALSRRAVLCCIG